MPEQVQTNAVVSNYAVIGSSHESSHFELTYSETQARTLPKQRVYQQATRPLLTWEDDSSFLSCYDQSSDQLSLQSCPLQANVFTPLAYVGISPFSYLDGLTTHRQPI